MLKRQFLQKKYSFNSVLHGSTLNNVTKFKKIIFKFKKTILRFEKLNKLNKYNKNKYLVITKYQYKDNCIIKKSIFTGKKPKLYFRVVKRENRKRIFKGHRSKKVLPYLFFFVRNFRIIRRCRRDNLTTKYMTLFDSNRQFFFFKKLFIFCDLNLKYYLNSYINLFFFKKTITKTYDLISADLAKDCLFYELTTSRYDVAALEYDNVLKYIINLYSFERFNTIDFNFSCFTNEVFVMGDHYESDAILDTDRYNSELDFIFFGKYFFKKTNSYTAGSFLLFPKDRYEYLNYLFEMDEDEVEEETFIASRFNIINDYYLNEDDVFFIFDACELENYFLFCDDLNFIYNYYKFISILMYLKINKFF